VPIVQVHAGFGVDQLKKNVLLTLSFWTWLGFVSFGMIVAYRGLLVDDPETPSMFKYQITGWTLFAISALLLYPTGFVNVWRRLNIAQSAIVVVIICSTVLQFQGDSVDIATGLTYVLVLICTALMLPLIWTFPLETTQRALAGSALVLVGAQLSSIIVLGWPHDRYVGMIHPNLLGTIILPAFILAQFGAGKLMILVKVISVLVAASVSSRYCLFGSVIAFLVFQLTFNRFRAKTIALLLAAACILVLLAQQYADVLALNDPARGLGSGFTGREDQWTSAFDWLTNNPLGAGYKRSELSFAGHNGFIKLFVEFGVLGGAILTGAVLLLAGWAVVTAYFFSGDPVSRRLSSARAAGLVALAFAAFFQPQVLNIGDAMGITIILLAFGPDRTFRFKRWTEMSIVKPRRPERYASEQFKP
jgi:O-antigen ligase/polysaccharide polymerase Wzy-like membrane protein